MFLYGFVGNAPCGGLLLEKLQPAPSRGWTVTAPP